LAEIVYSIDGVVKEIKDANTRASLQVLPYEFKLKEPTSDSIKFGKISEIKFHLLNYFKINFNTLFDVVSNFSRKTGDYSSLSLVDLHLLALAYQLCKESLTSDEFARLKTEPKNCYVNIDNS
jgi:RNA-binding protein NOB1